MNIDIDNTSTCQKINEENLAKFKTQLQTQASWTEVYSATGTQTKYDIFIQHYTSLYNQAFPKKSIPKKNKFIRKNSKPWMVSWLAEACDRKNKLYHKFITHPTAENKHIYSKMEKFCTKHTKLTKQKYYQKYFDTYTSTTRAK